MRRTLPSSTVSCYDSLDVKTHFRIAIPSGESTFTVQVPQNYLLDHRRRFFFNELHLTPDFYSLEAEKHSLDADKEPERIVERNVNVKIYYKDAKTAYGPTYENATTITDTPTLLAKMNEHFDEKRASFMIASPFFIDWVDLQLQEANELPSDYVPKLANYYYGKELNDAEHKNALPVSVRNIRHANNFKLPVGGPMEADFAFLNRIRLRIWLGPFSRAAFSNVNTFVESLGFEEQQMGRIANRQHVLTNATGYWVAVVTAAQAPNLEFDKSSFRLTVAPSSPFFVSKIKQVAMKQKDFFNNPELAKTLTAAFKQTARAYNIHFSFKFDTTSKKFLFSFIDPQYATMQIVCDPDFAHRLGYGYVTIISSGMEPQPQKDRFTNDDAHTRAVAVVFDTGPLVCTLDQVSSNTTSGSLYQTVAALYPKMAGTLSMPRSVCQCAQSTALANAVQLNAATHTSATNVPITFRLLRIYDDQSTADFAWTCDGYVYGVLQGTCPPGMV